MEFLETGRRVRRTEVNTGWIEDAEHLELSPHLAPFDYKVSNATVVGVVENSARDKTWVYIESDDFSPITSSDTQSALVIPGMPHELVKEALRRLQKQRSNRYVS